MAAILVLFWLFAFFLKTAFYKPFYTSFCYFCPLCLHGQQGKLANKGQPTNHIFVNSESFDQASQYFISLPLKAEHSNWSYKHSYKYQHTGGTISTQDSQEIQLKDTAAKHIFNYLYSQTDRSSGCHGDTSVVSTLPNRYVNNVFQEQSWLRSIYRISFIMNSSK